MLSFVFTLASCDKGFSEVDLKKPIPLSESGIVEKAVFDSIKRENSIATFTGVSNGLSYEWTVFGSDIEETNDVNLHVALKKIDGGIEISFAEGEALGFNALLSIYLDEKWSVAGATAYNNDLPISSVAVTGSKTSILNLPLKGELSSLAVLKDEEKPTSVDVSRPSSDGSAVDQDKYLTDPVPEGKPLPVEPENQKIDDSKSLTCTFSIECSTILNNLSDLDPDKLEILPSNGVILPPTTVAFHEGESVYDVLLRVCRENGIHLEFSWTPIYNSAYIEGIHNLYEFDCGALSGWMYRVDGWYPNYGCSRYRLADGEVVEWRYTCDLGKDVGCDWMA
ncbi:MAG: DUF4430 domain-containing protein [Clostridia bacterium]|nr:DUF4430 domain-containing protein [Clostridia bacterium]